MRKLIKFLNILVLLSMSLFFSCSDDKTINEPKVESIILSSDLLEAELGQTIKLSVQANTKQDVTSQSVFFVNDKQISSSSFSPKNIGTYQILAKYENLKSNTINLKVNKVAAKAITISISSQEISKNEAISISVKTDTDEDISNECDIYVNDKIIDGHEFSSDTSGEYIVHAVYGKLTSKKITFKVLGAIEVYTDKKQIMTGKSVTIQVKKENGDDISKDAVIYVNGNKINGLSFTPNKVGNYTIYATYGSKVKSTEISFSAVNSQTSFQKHPVVEAFVHMSCPYCPRIHYAIELLKKQTDNVIPIMLHPVTKSTWVDHMYNEDAKFLFYNTYNVETVPNGIIDRLKISHPETGANVWKKWSFDYSEHKQLNVVLDLVDKIVHTGFALELNRTKNQLHLKAKVNFLKDFDEKLNLAVYILENKIVHDQANNPKKGFYEGVNPIKDFVNDNVYKGSFSGIWGESIPSESTLNNNIYIKELTTTIPESINNSEEITVVAIVTNAETKEILNARSITLGDSKQKFEFK